MAQGMFAEAAFNELSRADQNDFTNARFARIGDQQVGIPFPLFRQSGDYFTSWAPSGQQVSNLRRQMNLPTNNTMFRNAQEADAINLANKQNKAWLFRTQTLANNGDPIACRNNSDCASWPGTTCNPQYSSWNDSKGNQGNYCAATTYPELDSGTYTRKNVNEGGIGRSCRTDNDCGENYFCNNKTDIFGKNIQQTGFCSMIYNCPDGQHYLGTPAGSGVPIPPPRTQNNNGKGYRTEDECVSEKLAQQNCIMKDNSWFAVYPAVCPVPTNARQGGNPQGALPRSSISTINEGIIIPPFATSEGSAKGGKKVMAFAGWNINSDISNREQMSEPLQYSLSINPRG